MSQLLALLHYVTAPGSASFGTTAWLLTSVSALVAAGGIVLAVTPQAVLEAVVARAPRRRNPARGDPGPGQNGLRVEFWGRVGLGISLWCFAFILAIVLRWVGTSGLTSRILPALALVVLVFLAGYVTVYRLVFYPRYLAECRQIDARKAYQPTAQGRGKGKTSTSKAAAQALHMPMVELSSGKATIGAFSAPFIYYFVGIFALPGSPNHDHAMHQFGMVVAALLGYVIGLALSLGDGLRTASFWQRGRKR